MQFFAHKQFVHKMNTEKETIRKKQSLLKFDTSILRKECGDTEAMLKCYLSLQCVS